eukprot:TRINITY_DN77327_c0_g1_i1.p4 TRINITY_DN77327_c0_g1~~TRINITY_DN77327_c0_g1_i1.p4  ORF type:complete len:108 (-),score=10.93 TRINITY_DN77327_c0_g1_i1:198-521(-)
MKQLAVAWKRLTDMERKPYKNTAIELKAQKDEMRKQVKASRGPLSAYPQFVKENYSKVKSSSPGKTSPQVIAQLAVMWKSLPNTERSRLITNATYARSQFKKLQGKA